MTVDFMKYEGKFVLTTQQVARLYRVKQKSLMRNFQRHCEQFTEGKHFFALSGEDLKAFKAARPDDGSLKYVSFMYLWTEDGVRLLAKSINSQSAWQAYDALAASYFRAGVSQRITELEQKLALTTLHSGEQKRLRIAVQQRVRELAKLESPVHYSTIYRAIKKRYNVSCYRDVPQCQLQDALQFVARFEGGAHR